MVSMEWWWIFVLRSQLMTEEDKRNMMIISKQYDAYNDEYQQKYD